MTSFDFQTTSYGKWIRVGEHAVLRGCKALVFPLKSKSLTLNFSNQADTITANFSGEHADSLQLLFFSILEHGLSLIDRSINAQTGYFILENDIPIGTGLGASAALCTAVAKWFTWKNYIKPEQLMSFAQELEDLFHGKSSGLDIAGSLSSAGIIYKQGHTKELNPRWLPSWSLSYSGHIGITAHCVKKVEGMWEKDPKKAKSIDNKMAHSVELAIKALNSPSKREGLALLIHAMEEANQCFSLWGLIDDNMNRHLSQLKELGALTSKPTGSGSGGFILSLWENKKNIKSDCELFSVQ